MKTSQRLLPAALTLLLLAAGTAPALAATYYVATNGDNSAAGTRAAPWKSIAHAVGRMEAGDTAWYLISELTREETEEYLENRRQKGLNAVLVSLGETDLTDKPARTRYRDPMFITPDDFSTTNEKFFAHVGWVVRKAREKGILVVLNPCYTGVGSSRKDALAKYFAANGPPRCRHYGRYIGSRFKSESNIIWQAVGDLTPTPGGEMEKNWLEILLGIKEHAPDHLWSAHYRRCSTDDSADRHVRELWSVAVPFSDDYARYLYTTSLLVCSGRFRTFLPAESGGKPGTLKDGGKRADPE